MLKQQLRMNDRGMDIEEPNNHQSGSQDLTPMFEKEPTLDKSKPSYKGSRRKQLKEEKMQVGELFKELIFAVNSHILTNDISRSEFGKMHCNKLPVPVKKKSKPIKPHKEPKEIEIREDPIIQQMPTPKNIKKLSVKPDAKQLQKEQQAKSKSQIFKNYSKIMTYIIHPEEKIPPQEQIHLNQTIQRSRKTFTIQKNLHVVFDPTTKEAKVNQ